MQLLVGGDSLLELLLAYIAPRADSVAHDFNVKLRHSAQSGPEHALEGSREKTSFSIEMLNDRRVYVQWGWCDREIGGGNWRLLIIGNISWGSRLGFQFTIRNQ
jgi:hypothetical protein